MSQIAKNNLGGISPPSIPTSFVADDGTVIPSANTINFNGAGLPNPLVIDDNDNGIETYANPDLSNNLAIFLTNRKVGSGSTIGAGTTDLFTQNLGSVPGTYNFQIYCSGFESTTPSGCAYVIFGSIRTTGAAATILTTQELIADKEPALIAAAIAIVISGNDVIIRVTGVVGLTINYKVLANYIFVG